MSGTSPLDHPERIGPYTILQVIGEGGMGVVYEAEQKTPVRRRVAIKMMKVGMDTKDVVGRFEAERQALAVMDHPGIAKVFDAGATEHGRPYFVMELVRGVRLDEFCDGQRLTTRQRVELFVSICEAVQHAHQKGVIHRDLKPSNILVGEESGRLQPRIIDFGVAKATGQKLSQDTVVTTYGQAMGTLAYMSPEQAELSGLDVDTRSDIYSLGVILYELLLGVVPLDPQEVGVPAFLAVLIERDWSVPTPNKRLTSLGADRRTALARFRRTDVSGLRRDLDGDLQWIVLKAMEKERVRRYETANGLAADLRRFLADEPVEAHPPSTGYRLRKFVRRHRPVVAMAAAMAALSVGYVASMAVQNQRVAEERDRAALEAETAQRVSDFMVELFEVSDPSEARGRSITAREILERGSARINDELTDDPVVQGRLMHVMGDVYMGLGLYDESEDLLLRGLEARRRGAGTADSTVGVSLHNLAWLYQWQGRREDALSVARQAEAIYAETLGPNSVVYARLLQVIGMIERDLGNFAEGRTALDEALSIRTAALPPDHPDIGWNHYHIGWLQYLEGDPQAARVTLEEAIRVLEGGLPADDPELGSGLHGLAVVLGTLGEFREARQLQERILAIRVKTQGPNHPDVAQTLDALAIALNSLGEGDLALQHQERALAIRIEAYHPEHSYVAGTLNNMGLTLQAMGRYREARDRYEAALRIYEANTGEAESGLKGALSNLGYLYRYVGDTEAARPLLQRSLRLAEATYGTDHIELTSSLTNLGFLERDLRRYAEAVPYVERALTIATKTFGEGHPQTISSARYASEIALMAGDAERSLELAEKARRASGLSSDSLPSNIYWALAVAHRALGDTATADSFFEGAREAVRAGPGEDSVEFATTEMRYWALMGNPDLAVEWLGRAVARGYRDPWLLRNPELDLIRGSVQYETVAARIRDATRLEDPAER